MHTPESPKEDCKATENFCLRLNSTTSVNSDILILMEDSQPAPAKNNPIEAIVIFQLAHSNPNPIVVTVQVRTIENLRPKLSAKKRKIIYPKNTPTYNIDLSKFNVF